MKITIKDKEIELKQSIRSLMLYENIEGKTFNPTTTTDFVTYMYCVVVASSKDYSITFEEFLDAIDENPDYLKEFTEWLISSSQNQNKLKKE